MIKESPNKTISNNPRKSKESIRLPKNSSPSILKIAKECNYAVHLGDYLDMNIAFNLAVDLESKIKKPVSIFYNNKHYSLRTTSYDSFIDVLELRNQLSSTVRSLIPNVIHQCYEDDNARPKPVKYLIEFHTFENQVDGLNYTLKLLDNYDITAYMKRVSGTYKILTSPFISRNQIINEIEKIKNRDDSKNLRIRHYAETSYHFDYKYQIQVDILNTSSDAFDLQKQVTKTTGMNTRIEEFYEDSFSVLTEQSNDWDEIQEMLLRINKTDLGVKPIVHVLEYTPSLKN